MPYSTGGFRWGLPVFCNLAICNKGVFLNKKETNSNIIIIDYNYKIFKLI